MKLWVDFKINNCIATQCTLIDIFQIKHGPNLRQKVPSPYKKRTKIEYTSVRMFLISIVVSVFWCIYFGIIECATSHCYLQTILFQLGFMNVGVMTIGLLSSKLYANSVHKIKMSLQYALDLSSLFQNITIYTLWRLFCCFYVIYSF